MKPIQKLLLVIFSLLLAAFSLTTFFVTLGWTAPLNYLNSVFTTVNNRWIIGFSAVAVFIVSVNLLFMNMKSHPALQTKVNTNEIGEISITLPAVETLVKKAAFQIKGIKEVKPYIKFTPNGIAVLIKAAMHPGTVIPQSAQELQTTVKNYLEQCAGLEVVEVKVLITNVSQETKGRVD